MVERYKARVKRNRSHFPEPEDEFRYYRERCMDFGSALLVLGCTFGELTCWETQDGPDAPAWALDVVKHLEGGERMLLHPAPPAAERHGSALRAHLDRAGITPEVFAKRSGASLGKVLVWLASTDTLPEDLWAVDLTTPHLR